MHPVTKRRLRDGETAAAVPTEDLGNLTLAQLQTLRQTVFDGALAMQSLDDLGSAEANEAAWLDYLALEQKLKLLDEEIKKR